MFVGYRFLFLLIAAYFCIIFFYFCRCVSVAACLFQVSLILA